MGVLLTDVLVESIAHKSLNISDKKELGKKDPIKKKVNLIQKTIVVISSHTPSLFWFRMNMMQDFVRRNYHVVAVGQEPEKDWKEKFLENGIGYRQLYVERNGMNPLHDLKTIHQLELILKQIHPDKIFCYQAKTVIYTCMAAKKNGISEVYPLIAGIGSVFCGEYFKNHIIKAVMVMEYKIALRNSKKVMFQNVDDLNAFIHARIIKRKKSCIINGSGVDLSRFKVAALPPEPVFLMIARLIKDKGVMEYLEACRVIKKNNPTARCLLVGPFDTNPSALKMEELQEYINDGSVEYFGEKEDVRPYIEQASIFVLPSYHEGTPKTVLENMASGRAIITTDAPGCRETVIDNVNGFLVPVKDSKAIALKMQFLIDNPDLVMLMGQKGRKIAEDKYDVNKVNESIIEIMQL